MRPFEIEVRDGSGVTTVSVNGELDIATSEQLDAVLSRLQETDSTVVLDLAGCEFVDSTGLRAILRGAGAWDGSLAGGGRRLAIAGASEPVRRVLAISGVGDAVPLFDSSGAAADSLSARDRR